MALDPNISLHVQPVQLQNPLTQFAQVAAIQNAQQQNALTGLAMQDRQRAIADKDAQNAAWAGAMRPDNTIDPSKLFGTLAQSGQGSAIPGVRKQLTEADTAALTQKKAQIELHTQQLGAVGQVLGGVTDQASYDLARQWAITNIGPDSVANMPPQYDPRLIATKRQEALTVQQQLEQANKAVDQQLQFAQFGESRRHNQATEGTAAGNLRVAQGNAAETVRHNGATEAQGRAPAGYRLNADGSLAYIPGGPADPAIKATGPASEDERKAAGWVSQAENAFKNMRSVMFDQNDPTGKALDKSVIAPGVLENAAQSVGLEQTANMFRPEKRQQFVQASSSLSEALLRAATGAGVNRDEAQQKINELTPQLNDKPAVIQQKLDAIPVYLTSLRTRADRALPKNLPPIDLANPRPGDATRIEERVGKEAAVAKAAARSGNPANYAPAPGTIEGGFRFKGGNPANPAAWEKA